MERLVLAEAKGVQKSFEKGWSLYKQILGVF